MKSGKKNWFIFNNCHFNSCARAPNVQNGHLCVISVQGGTIKVASYNAGKELRQNASQKASMELNDSVSGAGCGCCSHNA